MLPSVQYNIYSDAYNQPGNNKLFDIRNHILTSISAKVTKQNRAILYERGIS